MGMAASGVEINFSSVSRKLCFQPILTAGPRAEIVGVTGKAIPVNLLANSDTKPAEVQPGPTKNDEVSLKQEG